MTTATKTAVDQAQYLTFLLAGEEYALGILKVKEIIEYDTVTTVPKTPAGMRTASAIAGPGGEVLFRQVLITVDDLAYEMAFLAVGAGEAG